MFKKPESSKRFSRILDPALYAHWPFVDSIVTDNIQQRVLNLPAVTIQSAEGENITLSCNIRYQVMDFYRAYTAVHDYEASLKDHALSILAKGGMGLPKERLTKREEVLKLAEEVRKDLRKVVTDEWGLKIHEVYVTDNPLSQVIRLYNGDNAKKETLETVLTS